MLSGLGFLFFLKQFKLKDGVPLILTSTSSPKMEVASLSSPPYTLSNQGILAPLSQEDILLSHLSTLNLLIFLKSRHLFLRVHFGRVVSKRFLTPPLSMCACSVFADTVPRAALATAKFLVCCLTQAPEHLQGPFWWWQSCCFKLQSKPNSLVWIDFYFSLG